MQKFYFQILLILAFWAQVFSCQVFAQVSVGPNSDTKIAACDGIGSLLFQNPIDFSEGNCTDANNYFPGIEQSGINNISCADGTFTGTTTSAGPTMYLLSPVACGAHPVGGRFGQNYSIDVSKYNTLTFRMYSESVDGIGYRLIWDRDCNYANVRSVTAAAPVAQGWENYTVNLNSVSIDSSTNTSPWSNGSITGLALLPTVVSGNTIKLDWFDIVDSSSCGNTSVSYSASPSGSDRRVSIFLDDDTNPFNGFHKQLLTAAAASGASSVTASALGVAQGEYQVIGLLHSDYFTLIGRPFDMSSSSQILASSGVNSLSVSGGVATGTTASTSTNLYLRIPSGGFSAATYSSFSMKLTPAGANHRIIWFNSNGGSSFKDLSSYHVGGGVYEIDLSGESQWTANITDFVIRPAQSSGVNFELDFATFADDAFYSSLNTATIASSAASSSGNLIVNTIPTGQFKSPDEDGGVRVAAWDMDPGDLVTFSGLSSADDSAYSGEKLSCWLPDVREVDGVRGSLWKSTNTEGNFDPVQYLTFPGTGTPAFSASDYYHLCVKQFTDIDFSLGGGAVGRVIWRTSDTDYKTSEDLVLNFNGWLSANPNRGWTEYCMNMNEVPLEGGSAGAWTGTIDGLRFDPHEYTESATTYTDYISLSADPSSPGVFAISLDFADADNDAQAALYYANNNSGTGGTLITTLTESTHSYYKWDTTGIASGTYYLYAVLDDGQNSNTIKAKTPIKITNSADFGEAPVLSLETPTSAMAVCNDLQVKGYTLQSDRLEPVKSVRVRVNGDLVGTIRPSKYNTTAQTNYPNMLSGNAGFDDTFNISGYSNGSLTVEITAVSSSGEETTSSLSITKQSTGCPSVVEDAAPAGSPVTEAALDTDGMEKPALSISTKGKVVTFKVVHAGTNADECSITISGRSTKTGPVIASKAVTMGTNNKVTLKSKAGASPYKLFHSLVRTCRGNSVSAKLRTTGAKAITAKTKKTANKYLKSLYSKLK